MRTLKSQASRYAGISSALVVLAAWILISEVWDPLWLPTVSEVAVELWELITSGSLAPLGETGITLLVGVGASFILAAILASLMASSRLIEDSLLPFVNGFLSTPHIALIPVFTFIWGNSEFTRVVTVISFAISPVILTWLAALKSAQPDLIEMSTAFGAGPVAKARFVRLPSAVSPMIAGVRIGVMQGIKGVVSAEVIIGVVGIGKLITTASHTFNMAQVYALVLLIIALSIVVYLVLMRLEQSVTRWNG